MNQDQVKKAIKKRGEDLLPREIIDVSGFFDLGKIQNIEYINIGVHDPEARCHHTVVAKAIVDKGSNNLRGNLKAFFEICDKRNVDIIAMTADNATNTQGDAKRFEENLRENLGASKVFSGCHAFLLPCWPHTVQLLCTAYRADCAHTLRARCAHFLQRAGVGRLTTRHSAEAPTLRH